MSDVISPLLQWLNAHPELAGLATFLISAGESVAILGTIVPGSIMMTALGALAGAGVIPLWGTIFWAILGAIVGDGISYWIGHYFKGSLNRIWPFREYPKLLESGEAFVHKYGSMSVFIGRFVGPVRALVPMAAGMLGMKPLQFTIANVTSAIGWAPAYMLPGILLGAASLELPPDIAIHVMLVLVLITLFIMLCLWFLYKLTQLISNQINQVQNGIWHRLKKLPQLSPITILLKHHNPHRKHGQLNLAFYFLFTSFLFLCLAAYVNWHGPDGLTINNALYHFFRGIRTKGLDSVMIDITLLGQKQVILPVVIVVFGWLIFSKRWRLAFHALALAILAAGGVFVIKNIFKSPRPWGIFSNSETYSMPSGHATLATTVFIGFAFLVARSVRPKYRWPIYTIAVLIALSVGISRMYLGAHWFTDVLGAWLFSAVVLIFVIISYERQKEKPIHPFGILVISFLTLVITYGFFHYRHIDELKTNYAEVSWPSFNITMDEWWMRNDVLPIYHVSLFGFPTLMINIEWVGNMDKIKKTLLKEGWTEPPARDWISTLHRLADVESTEYLPMVSPQYLDKRPELILTRRSDGVKNPLVLRIWDSNRLIKETQATLWVGIIGVIPRTYGWLYKSKQEVIEIDPALVFPNKTGAGSWEWKMLLMNQSNKKSKNPHQKIMLVRQNPLVHKKR